MDDTHAIAKRTFFAPRRVTFPVQFEVVIRMCKEEDLPNLEWFGLFTEHREIIRAAFLAQQRGANLMLLATANRVPAGQLWIDLEKRAADQAGLFWAIRVCPWLQRLGIGGRLLASAEEWLSQAGFKIAELGVEKWNTRARRWYERRGYQCDGDLNETFVYQAPSGSLHEVHLAEWVMRKRLPG